MRKKVDLAQWARKDHFNFFTTFEEPFFGVCVEVDCTKALATVKTHQFSFFLYYLHKALKAANGIEEFRYRIVNEEVYNYDAIHASPTIARPDGTFGFSYIDYYEDFRTFQNKGLLVIEEVKNSTGLNPAMSGENVIHFSSLPWLKFTSVSHARSFSFADSCPKISFGKVTEVDGKMMMPVSVHAHHALVDGSHVGIFIDQFQKLLNEDL